MSARKDSLVKRKLDTNLLYEDLAGPLTLVNEVLHFAAYEKPEPYGPRNWMSGGDEFIYELKAARHRHRLAISRGETTDPESGKPHRAHIIACDLFLLHFEEVKECVKTVGPMKTTRSTGSATTAVTLLLTGAR